MLYNKAILADNSLKVPTTIDEWLDAVNKVTKGDILGYNTFAIGAGAQEFMTWYWYGIVQPIRRRDGQRRRHQGRVQHARRHRGDQMDEGHAAEGQPQERASGRSAAHRQGRDVADGPWICTLYFDKTKASAADDIDVTPLPQHDPEQEGDLGPEPPVRAADAGATPIRTKRAATLKFVMWMGEHSVDWAKAGQVPARNSARQEALKQR